MPDYRSHFVSTLDGLKLHVRIYGIPARTRSPVVCLHGLARTGADFHRLAIALSTDPATPRQVFAMDYRGRGRSDHDPDPANYNVGVELNDVLTVLASLGEQDRFLLAAPLWRQDYDDDIDQRARQNEARHAYNVVNLDGHGAIPVRNY